MTGMIRLTDTTRLGEALGEVRGLLGLSRRGLARLIAAKTGKSLNSIANQLLDWDEGKTSPTGRSLGPVLEALGYDLALVPRVEPTPTVHVTAAEFATNRFWAEHVDPVAREHGIEARGLELDPGDPVQYLLKDDDGRLLLVVRTDREDA